LPRSEVAALASRLPCPLVVDEAYGDFADPETHAAPLVHDHPNIIVTRSFSKGYSLAGLRLGYLIAPASLVEQLVKVKDSYNCDALSLAGGVAAIEDQAYLAETRGRVRETRSRLTSALCELGFQVPDSQANFVWATGGLPARETFLELKERRIFVRYMNYPGVPDGLRISVGTDAEIDVLLDFLRSKLGS
jgi:histidinol-phosphate aminotransferase